MKEIRNRNKIDLIPIFHIKAFVSTKLYRQLTSLMMSIVISTVTVLGNTTVALADKKDDVINRIIEQYENGDISRDEAKRALIRNGVTNSPIIDLNEDEDGNELATDSDLVKKLGEKDRLIDEKIRKIIEDNRDDDTSVVFAWHHEDADSIIDELSDVATKSELKKSEADDNQESKKSVGIYYDKFNKTNKSSETADSETESENIEEAVDTEDDAAVDEESVSEGEVSDENQASEEMMEDDSLDEENEDSNSVDESVDPYAFFMNQLQADENETFESVEENEGFENNSLDEEAEVSESVNPYEFFMNQFQNEETEVSDSVEEDEVFEDDSQDEEDEKEDSDSVEEDEVLGNDSQDEEDVKEEENSDSVETTEADENESEDEEKEENSNIIKVDKFFEIDSYVENEDSDSENSEEETTEAETEAAKAIGIMAHSDKNAIAQTAEDAEAEVDADAEIEAETETKAAKAIGILAHSEKTATAQTEETTEAAEEEKDYDVIDLSEYMTVSSAFKKFHEEWIESESFDSGNKIGLTLYFSIPEDVMYDKDTRVAAYSMPEGLTSQFEGKGKVISGDETVGTYKLKKNEIEITFDTAFVKSGKSIEGALFFKGRVENNTDEDCLTIELGGTAGSLDVYKEIKKEVVSEDGKVLVTATFGASTFDGDVTLYADSLDEETRNDIISAYNEKLSEEDRQVADLYLYDVYFLDEEGNKIEPDGHVSVKMTFTEPAESGNDEDIKVIHVKDNDPSDIEDLTSMDDTVVKVNSNGEVKDLELVTDSFSLLGYARTQTINSMIDISEFLSSMTIEGAQRNDNTWTVEENKQYKLHLTFTEIPKGIQFPRGNEGNKVMYYVLPKGLILKDIEETYFDVEITDDGKIYVIHGNKLAVDATNGILYLQWNTEDENIDRLYKATDKTITADLSGSLNSKETVVTFELPYSVEKKNYIEVSHHAHIEKKGTLENDGSISYTLTVYSTGISNNVIVTDTINDQVTSLNSGLTLKSNKCSSVDYKTINMGEKGFTIKIPQMVDGEVITIEYKAKFVDTIPEGTEFTKNTAKSSADRDYDSYDERSIRFSSLSKSYKPDQTDKTDENGTYNTIQYIVEANKERVVDLSYITDTITIDNGKDISQYLGFDRTGLKIRISYKDGTSEDIVVPLSDPNLEITKSDSNSYIWKWKIPEKYKNGKKASFKITYTVNVYKSQTEESYNIKNSVKTTYHGEVSTTTTITNGPTNKDIDNFKKTVGSYNNEEVEWIITLKIPKEGYNELYLYDYLPYTSDEAIKSSDPNFYDTLIKGSVTVSGLDLTKENYKISDPQNIDHSEDGKKKGEFFKIEFFKDTARTIKGINGEKEITIKYKTTVNKDWLDQTSTHTYLTPEYYEHKNTAKIYYDDHYMWIGDKVDLYKNMKKTGEFVYVKNETTQQNELYVVNDSGSEYYLLEYTIQFGGTPDEYPDVITLEDKYDDSLYFYDEDFKDNKAVIGGNYWNPYGNHDLVDDLGNTVAEFNFDDNNHKLTIRIPKDKLKNKFNQQPTFYEAYYVKYYLKIKKEDAAKAALKTADTTPGNYTTILKNHATWNGLSSDGDVTYEHKILDKTLNYVNDIANYTITINPNKDMLNEGKVMELTDIFENLTIDDSIISITADGQGTADEIEYQINGNVLTFNKIPDQTKVEIKYKALPKFESSGVLIKNKATLLSKERSVERWVKFEAAGSGHGSTASLKLIKHKKGDENTKLQGAVFELYKVDDDCEKITDSTGKTHECRGTALRYNNTDDPNKSGKIIRFTTNNEGVAKISLDKYTYETLEFGQKYCLIEVEAPDGYQVDADNVYYFTIATKTTTELSYDPNDPIYQNGYVLKIANEKKLFALPDTGSIGVNLMYLAGTIMVALSGIFLILRRRKEYQL